MVNAEAIVDAVEKKMGFLPRDPLGNILRVLDKRDKAFKRKLREKKMNKAQKRALPTRSQKKVRKAKHKAKVKRRRVPYRDPKTFDYDPEE